MKATGAIETQSPSAHIALAAPSAFSQGAFTVYLWVRPAVSAGERAVLDIPGTLRITSPPNAGLSAELAVSGGGEPVALVLSKALPDDEWALVTLSLDPESSRVFLACESESRGFAVASADIPPSATLEPSTGALRLGASGSLPSLQGVFGLLAVRNHAVAERDARDVFATRQHSAPLLLNNTPTGGSMTGPNGVRWMINHAITPIPTDLIPGEQAPEELAAILGGPVTPFNVHVYITSASYDSTQLRIVRPVTSAQDMLYVSPFDGAAPLLRTPTPLTQNFPAFSESAAVAPLVRRIAEATLPDAPTRVFVSANSRGVRLQDNAGGPGAFADGFIEALRPLMSGVAFRQASTSNNAPGFAFRSTQLDPVRFGGNVQSTHQTNFSRFFTGSVFSGGVGPGAGLRLRGASAFIALRAGPEPGSLLTAETPVSVTVRLFAYPGSLSAVIFADSGASQSDEGVTTPLTVLDLDTTVTPSSLTVTQALSASGIVVPGDFTSLVSEHPGRLALTVLDGNAQDSISLVVGAVYNPDNDTTVFALEHPLERTPIAGSRVALGPYEFRSFTHTFPPDAERPWRGLRVAPSGSHPCPLIVLAYDAWNPEANGYIVGRAGWGGNGYDVQIEKSFASALPLWLAETQADAWFVMIAGQNSQPDSTGRFTDCIRDALPHSSVAWIGDVHHQTGSAENFHTFMLTDAAAFGVPAVSLLRRDEIGDLTSQYADAMRTDGAHLTHRGNTAIANAALDMLRSAARCPGDATNDAAVTFLDLNAVLSNFGQSGPSDGSLTGDTNLDGVVNFLDLNDVLTNFGAGCGG